MYYYNRHNISKSDIDNVSKSLKSKLITKGNFLKLFEKKLRKYFSAKYSLVYSNATLALFSIAKCLNWSKKDYIILSPISFVAGANAISNVNANPVFVDIDEFFNLDPDKVEKKIVELRKQKKKVKAILVTDYAGNPAQWKKFVKLKKKYHLTLINDNCHSLGAKLDGNSKYATKYSDLVVQSFHAVKNITSAEGGAIITNNKKYFLNLKSFREHGFILNEKNISPWSYNMNSIGFNARLSELNCALGSSQFSKLKSNVRIRNKIASFYNKTFENTKYCKVPKVSKNNYCSYHLYPLRFDWKKIKMNKYEFYKTLKSKYGINLQIHYKPTYKFNFYKSKIKTNLKHFKNTERFYNEVFSIPIYVGLKMKDLKYISSTIIKVINKK